MSGILSGKLAIITGAGSGIGRATCQVLAREGANIIAADIKAESVKETIHSISSTQKKVDNISVKLDVSNTESVKNCLQTVLNHYKKPPTIIVNCAGITRDNFLLKLSEEDFDEVINVNLKGTFLVTKIFANSLVENNVNNGSIINLASLVGKIGNIGQVNYAASKAGVELLTKSASKELGKFGIRCNTILPGFIETPMTNKVPEKVLAKLLPQISLGRMGKPEEVAELIAFLASDRSSFINGASIVVSGGFTD